MKELITVDFLSAPLLEDYFSNEGIFYVKESLLGAAVTVSLGITRDSFTFFVPEEHFDQAMEFVEQLKLEGLLK